jgi:hypothetical protein
VAAALMGGERLAPVGRHAEKIRRGEDDARRGLLAVRTVLRQVALSQWPRSPATRHFACNIWASSAPTNSCCDLPRTPATRRPNSPASSASPRARRSAIVAVQGQDKPRHRADPWPVAAHGRQASGADLFEAWRRKPHCSDSDSGQCQKPKSLINFAAMNDLTIRLIRRVLVAIQLPFEPVL